MLLELASTFPKPRLCPPEFLPSDTACPSGQAVFSEDCLLFPLRRLSCDFLTPDWYLNPAALRSS